MLLTVHENMYEVEVPQSGTSKYPKHFHGEIEKYQSPVVPSIISLTSLLVVKMLTVLISISNSQIFLLKKCD